MYLNVFFIKIDWREFEHKGREREGTLVYLNVFFIKSDWRGIEHKGRETRNTRVP